MKLLFNFSTGLIRLELLVSQTAEDHSESRTGKVLMLGTIHI
ncbi:hypothetical protein [Mesobacillus jeotgali]|nr:hypothetical protein [Mesobacillus jeotgali]